MKTSLFIIAVLLIVWFRPVPVWAANLEVSGAVTLGLAGSPYHFSDITVKSAGSLVVQPGVEIELDEGAEIRVDGRLQVEGTEELPIIIRGSTVNHPWKQLIVSAQAPPAIIRHVSFRYFQLPIDLGLPETPVEGVDLLDGQQNVLQLSTNSFMGSYYLQNLSFRNQQLAEQMGDSALKIIGSFEGLHIANVQFTDSRPQTVTQPFFLGIDIRGIERAGFYENIRFPSGCKSKSIFNYPDQYQFVIDRTKCALTQLPVVFVPGYGTSINLNVLTKLPSSVVQTDGWRFFNQLTPAYATFLNDLALQHIGYEVAYYDWRLPADQVVTNYLLPAIERAKAKYGAAQVQIVAHSFGGLVARAYIQSDAYAQDVANLVLLGTPNQGAVKAYPVWEAGELPDDWSSLSMLLRYYQYLSRSDHLETYEVVRRFFPSAKQLLPIYPALFWKKQPILTEDWYYPNTWLAQLSLNSLVLTQRVKVLAVLSDLWSTPGSVLINQPNAKAKIWPDGKPTSWIYGLGDGTVPEDSSRLVNAETISVNAQHNDLPAVAAEAVIRWLYPTISYRANSASNNWLAPLSFLFDCPVEVTIQLPDGTVRSSTQVDAPSVPGELTANDDLTWFVFPRLTGTYQVKVTATASSVIRLWLEQSDIQEFYLHQGESATYQYLVNEHGIQLVGHEESPLMQPPTVNSTMQVQESPSVQPVESLPTVSPGIQVPATPPAVARYGNVLLAAIPFDQAIPSPPIIRSIHPVLPTGAGPVVDGGNNRLILYVGIALSLLISLALFVCWKYAKIRKE